MMGTVITVVIIAAINGAIAIWKESKKKEAERDAEAASRGHSRSASVGSQSQLPSSPRAGVRTDVTRGAESGMRTDVTRGAESGMRTDVTRGAETAMRRNAPGNMPSRPASPGASPPASSGRTGGKKAAEWLALVAAQLRAAQESAERAGQPKIVLPGRPPLAPGQAEPPRIGGIQAPKAGVPRAVERTRVIVPLPPTTRAVAVSQPAPTVPLDTAHGFQHTRHAKAAIRPAPIARARLGRNAMREAVRLQAIIGPPRSLVPFRTPA